MTTPSLPLPPFLDHAWLRARGVSDPQEVLDALRPEDEVMSPANLRAIKATRLSFARSLILRMTRNRWNIELVECDIDASGEGMLIYEIRAEGRVFHFAVASLANHGTERTGRFCESEFDFLGSILDGAVDLDRARKELQEMTSKVWSGRTDNRAFGWTVANRSNRFFDHVVAQLVEGQQPDPAFLTSGGGYVIRNAGWYGNGRHGSRSWLAIEPGHPLGYPYHLDIFALYLWRLVGFDVAEAMARSRNPNAAQLDAHVKRSMGIGNSSGIGMVAALVRWPAWLSGFNFLRELALAYASTRRAPIEARRAAELAATLDRTADYYAQQPGCPVTEVEDPVVLAEQLRKLAQLVRVYRDTGAIDGETPVYPWRAIAGLAGKMSREAREQFHSVLIDLESAFTDEVATLLPDALGVTRRVEPRMTVGALRTLLTTRYAWALSMDLEAEGARAYFWYRSEENGENRRGERDIDPGLEHETFVDVAGAIQRLHLALAGLSAEMTVAEFLLSHSDLSHVVSRAQLAARLPYTEIRANIIDRDFLPMDGIRFLLGTMGLESSHPHNTRWVRGVFLQHSPLPADLAAGVGQRHAFSGAANSSIAEIAPQIQTGV